MLQALEKELQPVIGAHFAGCGSATTASNVAPLEQALASAVDDIPILSRPYVLEMLLAATKSSAYKLFDFYLTLPFRLAKGKSVNDSYDPALFCPAPSNGSIDAVGKYWVDRRHNTPDKDPFLNSISALPQFWHISQESAGCAGSAPFIFRTIPDFDINAENCAWQTTNLARLAQAPLRNLPYRP